VKTVTIEVRTADEAFDDTLRQLESGLPAESAMFTFVSQELLDQVLTEDRWQILGQLCGERPLPIKELAIRLGRDVKAVHTDVAALVMAGVVDRKTGGGISFPYDEIIYSAEDGSQRHLFR